MVSALERLLPGCIVEAVLGHHGMILHLRIESRAGRWEGSIDIGQPVHDVVSELCEIAATYNLDLASENRKYMKRAAQHRWTP